MAEKTVYIPVDVLAIKPTATTPDVHWHMREVGDVAMGAYRFPNGVTSAGLLGAVKVPGFLSSTPNPKFLAVFGAPNGATGDWAFELFHQQKSSGEQYNLVLPGTGGAMTEEDHAIVSISTQFEMLFQEYPVASATLDDLNLTLVAGEELFFFLRHDHNHASDNPSDDIEIIKMYFVVDLEFA